MGVLQHIEDYIARQSGSRGADLRTLHERMIRVAPTAQLWFLDGKDGSGKVVTNPNIGYGTYTIAYANGKTKEFYRVGLSANTTGISVYIMGLPDKTSLKRTFGDAIGKAKITGYCIAFKSLEDVDISVLEAAMRFGLERPA